MLKAKMYFLSFLLLISLSAVNAGNFTIEQLKTNDLTNPLGIDTPSPHFSWQMKSSDRNQAQKAYKLIISSTFQKSFAGVGDLFSSDRIESAQSSNLVIENMTLKSKTDYYWRVQVWDQDNTPKWSNVSSFGVAMLSKNDWTAEWIMADQEAESTSMPMFGTSFILQKKVASAKVYVCGLGLFEMCINGQKMTENVLEPGESTYNKTILYATYDITHKLKKGANAIVTRMGNGMYHNLYTASRYQVFSMDSYGPTRLLAQLEITYTDGTKEVIHSGKNWKTKPSAITATLWYGGEEYDANLEPQNIKRADYGFENWNPVLLCTAPIGNLRAQFYQPTKVVEQFKAIRVTTVAPDTYLVDFGRNFAGQYEFTLKANAKDQIVLKRSDQLDKNGRVLQYSDEYYKGVFRAVYESYTFKGDPKGETWGPRFVYHGMRYLEITGLKQAPQANQFTAKLIRIGVEKSGSFDTSNTLLNQIDLITNRSIEANLYNTITDCPHIEKLGWLEVPNLMYNSISPNYNVAAYMPKISMDIADNQRPNGMVHTFCPDWGKTYGGEFGDDPTWAAATIMVPWQSYQTYGNRLLLKNQYQTMTNLMNYYQSRSSDQLLKYGLGDWGAYDKSTSRDYTVSCTYYQVTTVMAQIAEILNLPDDVVKYQALATQIKDAINKTYYKSDLKIYDSGSQASNAMALYYGLVEEADKQAVVANLVKSVVAAKYHLTTGEVALKPLFLALAQNGHNDIVYQMAMQKEMPSYGYFIEQGCTSLPEFWDMYRSQMHCMMGHIEGWYYEYLAGIRNASVGYKDFIIQPYFTPELDHINISTHSVYGKITSAWKRELQNKITTTFVVPPNSTATIVIPVQKRTDVTENGTHLAIGNGINSITIETGKVAIRVSSGTYHFSFLQPKTY